nr:hypothetical protein [Tanacetum cinerariifolium]
MLKIDLLPYEKLDQHNAILKEETSEMFIYSSSSSRRKTQPHNASLRGIALDSRGINSSCRKQNRYTA